MKTSQNTILITGGSAGIGFEIAKLLSEKGNHVIITGRNKEKLDKAASQLRNVTTIVSDVTNSEDINKLSEKLYKDFPGLNVVINNAGQILLYSMIADGISLNAFEKAGEEMLTNYLSVIRLNEKLMPLLKKQPQAAIVNVSSIVAFAPGERLAGYSASKAALHSYTRTLRLALEDTSVKVFELMPPLVDTEFSREIGGQNGIPPKQVAEELYNALQNDQYEVHVGRTAELYRLSLTSPLEALKAMNSK